MHDVLKKLLSKMQVAPFLQRLRSDSEHVVFRVVTGIAVDPVTNNGVFDVLVADVTGVIVV